jgi:hypothetical protein
LPLIRDFCKEHMSKSRGLFTINARLQFGLVLGLTCLLASCGSSNTSPNNPPPPPPPSSGSIVWKQGSTTPSMQVNGDIFQFFVNGTLSFYPTASKTVTNSGAVGMDLGIPASFPGKVVFPWGDSTPVYRPIFQAWDPVFIWPMTGEATASG